MPRSVRSDGLDKIRLHHTSRRARGMKLVRVWVPDPRAPGFREEVERQAALLREAAEETEALEFIEAAADWADEEA